MHTTTPKRKKPKGDRIVTAIDTTQTMLSRLKAGLTSGEPLDEMERLARDAAIAATMIETMVAERYHQERMRVV